jgi:hypothetical protein
MREDHPVSRSSDLPQWIFLGVLMSLILLTASFGTPNSDVSAHVAKQGQQEKLTDLQLLQRQVDAGDPEAQRLMAIRYRDGIGVLRSATEMKRLLELSIKAGNNDAKYDLAVLQDTGFPGVGLQEQQAWANFYDAARSGHVPSMAYIAEACALGDEKYLIESYAWRDLTILFSTDKVTYIWVHGNGSRGAFGKATDYKGGFDILLSNLEWREKWLKEVSSKMSRDDIIAAQKLSRELLAAIEAKKAKK